MIDFEVSNSTTSIIRGRLPGESSCGPAGSVHRLGNVHSVDIVIEVTLREGSRHGTTKIKLQQVPKFLVNAFEFINSHGMDQEGLFRREGNASRLNQNNWAVYMGSAPIPANFSVHDVCTMVKRFFRDLKEPLLSGAGLRDRLIELVKKNQVAPVTRQEFAAVFEPEVNAVRKNVPFCLSRAHLGTLGFLMRQLHRIAHNSCKHQMTSLNLATVFAPTLFRDEVSKDKLKRKERRGSQDDILLNVREDTQSRIEAIQLLIEHANWIGLHPNCYLTSGHPRSSSAAPSPRQPPFVNVANLKEPPYVDRKYSLKEHTRQSAKTAERRASSTFRFIADKFVRKRSPSRDRTKLNTGVLRHSTNRRASSPAIVVPNELRAKDAKHERKTSTRYVLDFDDPAVVVAQQPAESHNTRSRDALRSTGARASRSRQHQSQSTTNAQQKTGAQKAVPSQSTGRATRYTVDSVTSSVVRRDSGKKRHFSPTVLKDTPASLASREHFLSSYGEGRERSRRRHTTPVKTNTALRRNQPNTLHSGLQQPKRRATVVNASEQEKENRSQDISASSSCEDIESTLNADDNSTMLTDSSADLLTQKGHESRLRRVKRQQRRELSSILQKSLLDSSTLQESSFFTKDRVKESRNLVSTACSPIIFPVSPSEIKPQRAHGSAIVGETIVISTGPMLSPSSDEPSINLPTDLNTTPAPPKPTTVPPIKNHYHSTLQTPSGTVTVVTKQMAPKTSFVKSYGDSSKPAPRVEADVVFRHPSLPPQPGHREEVCTNTYKMIHDRHLINTKQQLSSPRLTKPFALAFPRSTSMTTSFDSAISDNHAFAKPSKILSPGRVTPNDEPKDGLTSDDDMFACSNQMKSAILNATSELDINVHMDRQLRCRPSVALIEKQGIVRERVNQFRRLGNVTSMPLEPISGRDSVLCSSFVDKSSIGTGSMAGDEEFVKPTAPPVTHSLNMGSPKI
ncbi:unnamed protein product [Cylicocyclus nassatus]|uniref:Rho-GAP domain-containing protein n=1 Tax=Cylicocyclus nassatus TaxID=53992 RepID=A0AA36DIM7_CYLNA|nr:unnamed protein product [Cylicocyclus nassatus]